MLLLILASLTALNAALGPVAAAKRLRREQEKFKEPVCTLANHKLTLTEKELREVGPILHRGMQRFTDLQQVGAL